MLKQYLCKNLEDKPVCFFKLLIDNIIVWDGKGHVQENVDIIQSAIVLFINLFHLP